MSGARALERVFNTLPVTSSVTSYIYTVGHNRLITIVLLMSDEYVHTVYR